MKKIFAGFMFLFVSNLIFADLSFALNSKSNNSNNQITSSAQETKQTKILVLGDSLSAGYNIKVSEGWVNLLQLKLQESGSKAKVVNASISGDTTIQGLQRLPKLLAKHNPEIVIIELGGNDGLRGISPTLIKANLAKMIDLSKQTNAKVLLLGIQILPNYGKRYSEAFFNNYSELAKEKQVALVPFFLESVGGIEDLMQKDGIHPNVKAQPLLLENIYPTFKSLY